MIYTVVNMIYRQMIQLKIRSILLYSNYKLRIILIRKVYLDLNFMCVFVWENDVSSEVMVHY